MMFLNTGTEATNNEGRMVKQHERSIYFDTSAVWTYQTAIESRGNLSDGTDAYQIICGFLDDVSNSESVDGAYISYARGNIAANSRVLRPATQLAP